MVRYPSGWAVLICVIVGAGLPACAQPVDFVRDVQPIFKAACSECHGEKKPKGKLRLDSRGCMCSPTLEPVKTSP